MEAAGSGGRVPGVEKHERDIESARRVIVLSDTFRKRTVLVGDNSSVSLA